MMIIYTLIIGAIFIIYGYLLRYHTPKHSDKILGYKSAIFMRNEEAWYDSNKYFGRLILGGGIVAIIVSFLLMNFYKGNIDTAGKMMLSVYAFIALISSMFTEIHLFRVYGRQNNCG